jgi:hypothetical protein
MDDRFALITRKNEVRRQIEQVRRQLEREQAKRPASNIHTLRQLSARLEQLVAEEYRLRLAIDQSPHR